MNDGEQPGEPKPPCGDKTMEIFLAALDLEGDAREEFLNQACAGDAARRAEIDALFAYDQSFDPTPLDTAIRSVASGTLFGEDASWIGRRLGAYRIVEQVGEGGMGAVFLAERADQRFEKKVAIKLVARGTDSVAVRQRLVEERRILANLDHPYIAKLMDGGETEEGVPYFVMEYVDGRPVHEFARDLPLADVAQLMGRVCEAVAFAHRNLVVHRDLKPSNILVVADATPRLLDFGIAGALDQGNSNSQVVRAYTPNYAAPEVKAGLPVTTAADIYSLGVILRETTAGRDLPIGLRAVLDKALAERPEDRYHSAGDLAADLDRWRRGAPVQARPWSVGYRARLYILRHRWLVLAATLAIAGITASLAAALWQAHRANEALATARVEQRRAEQQAIAAEAARRSAGLANDASAKRLRNLVTLASTTLTDIHDTLEHIPGSTTERRKIVDQTLRLLEREQKEGADSPELLETVAEGYRRLGTVLGVPTRPNLGDGKAALEYLARAASIAARLRAQSPDSPSLWRIELSSTALSARVLEVQGGGMRGHQMLEPLIRAARQWVVLHPDAFDVIHAIAIAEEDDFVCLHNAALSTKVSSEPLRDAIAKLEFLLRRRPGDVELLKDLSSVHSRYAEVIATQNDVPGAIEAMKRVVAIREELVSKSPEDVLRLRELMIAYGKIGDMHGSPVTGIQLHDTETAYSYYRRTIALADRIVTLDSSDRNARVDAAMAVLHAGMIDPQPGPQVEQSVQFLNTAIERLERLGQSAQGDQTLVFLANAYEFLARRRAQQGNPTAAAVAARKSLSLVQDVFHKNPDRQRIGAQLLYSELAAIQLAAPAMSPGERQELLKLAHADFPNLIAGRDRMRHFPARLLEAEGDLALSTGATQQACESFRASLRSWGQVPYAATFEREINGIRAKLAASCP